MTEEGLNRFIAGVERAINERDWDAYGRFFAESLLMYAPGFPRPTDGREARVKMVQGIIAAFPDGRVELERSFVHGDWLCAQMTFSGTHTGPLASPDGTAIPPTEKPAQFPYCIVAKGEGGEITELHEYFDQLDLLTQLGLMS